MSETIVMPNRMKQALQHNQPVVGTMLAAIRQPAVMQLLVNAGFDFVIIDNEHGQFNIETIADLSSAARYVGLTPIVRVPDLAYPFLAQPLDAGAQGVMIPRVHTVEQAQEAAQIVKYPPQGIRGCALSRGHTNYKSGPLAETMQQLNDASLLVIQIETVGAVDAIEEIVSIPAVDVALVGPGDLSIALGVAGDMAAPVLHEAIEKVIDACQRHNTYPALHINDLEWAAHWIKKGMKILSSFSETGFLVQGGLQVSSGLKNAFE